MALPLGLLRFLTYLYKQHRFQGPLLTLGVQDISATYDDLQRMLQEEQIAVQFVPPEQRRATTSVSLKPRPDRQPCVHAETFFRMLGVDAYSDLDGSGAEQPAVVHDLNRPVPTELHGRFRWILDGGTTEHIFDIRSTLSNILNLLAVGGSVLHLNPMSGWANHGFYQLSPCLFYDFYEANGCTVRDAWQLHASIRDPKKNLRAEQYTHTNRVFLGGNADERTLFCCIVQKQQATTTIVVPTQTRYRNRFEPTARAG